MRVVMFAALLAVVSAASAQQLYRWIDNQGRVHVTDTPPPPTAKFAQTTTVTTGGAAQAPGESLPYAVQLAAKDSPVTLYTAAECGPCGEARNLLNARGVPFREVLVADEAQQQELQKAVGALAVPSIIVGGSVQKGFEQGAYHTMLDTAGYPRTGVLPPRNQAEPKPAAQPAAAGQSQAEPGAADDGDSLGRPSGPYTPR